MKPDTLPAQPHKLHRQFIDNVYHELRTPLQIIQGFALLLQDGSFGDLSPEQQGAMSLIVNYADRLHTLVKEIGVLLAIEGNMGYKMPLDLAPMLASSIEMYRNAADRAGITLSLALPQSLPSVDGDSHHLQVLIQCLIDNALKFTPEGGEVEVRAYTDSDALCIAVRDTGIGIPEEQGAHIFDPFYQVDGSPTHRYGGLGLGLNVVKRVVDEHGGQITFESEPGQGSTFTVRLPVTSQAVSGTAWQEDTQAMWRILIVDDEENVAWTLQKGLEGLPNCAIETATSGTAALAMFEKVPFDLMITDYKMPDMSGVALSQQIRSRYPKTVIIMMTAYGNDALLKQYKALPVRRILDKPINFSEVRSAALKALQAQTMEMR